MSATSTPRSSPEQFPYTAFAIRARLPLMGETDLARLRSCLGRFATGVAVVAFDGPDGRHGLTINSFTSVSMRPPLVLASVARRARAHDVLEGRPFSISILGAEQESVARCFAGGPPTDVHWVEGEVAPRIAGALASMECRPWRSYDGGDHTLFLGEVVAFEHRDGDALGYHVSGFTTIAESVLGVEHLI
jgi:flavin reductase (DIM6/NTAB) family NADH-FMN oxidoreductase RutF